MRRNGAEREDRMSEQQKKNPQEPGTGDKTDYKELYEQLQKDLEAAKSEAEKWKAQSRKQESRAKTNAGAAKDLEEANTQIAGLSERIAAIEGENATLKANAERAAVVSKVAKATGVAESIVSSLAANDEKGLTAAATAIAEAYKTPGGAPNVSNAGKFPKDDGGDGDSGDWLRNAFQSN